MQRVNNHFNTFVDKLLQDLETLHRNEMGRELFGDDSLFGSGVVTTETCIQILRSLSWRIQKLFQAGFIAALAWKISSGHRIRTQSFT